MNCPKCGEQYVGKVPGNWNIFNCGTWEKDGRLKRSMRCHDNEWRTRAERFDRGW